MWSSHFLGGAEQFPGGLEDKESACNAGSAGLIPGWRRSPGGGPGNPLQYSCLGNPTDGGAWLATDHGVAKSWTRLKRLSTHTRTSLGVEVGGSQGFLEAGLLALILSPSIKIHRRPPLCLCPQRPDPLSSSWLACSPPRTWGFGETKARCLSFGLLTQTSPESGARRGLASFGERRAGKCGDKNTN